MDLTWIVGFAFLAMAAWRLTCAEMRRRRLETLAKLQDHPHTINAALMSIEFPFLYHRSVEMGIMRTFAIPSISRSLRKGGQYAFNPSKRFDDTEILLTEMMVQHIDSPRASLAVRRLNYLHAPYAISNADYLYVLCLAIVVPPQWASMYGYRAWTKSEISCNYKVWHDIGVRMGIRDIPPTFVAAAKYIEDYEAKHMVYAHSNHEIAELNFKLIFNNMPMFLRPFARNLFYSFLDDRMREALGYPKQPIWLSYLMHALLKMHGVVVSWMPPRPFACAHMRISPHCPILGSLDDARATTFPLSFQRYKPYTYKQGYKISELGGLKSDKLSDACEGDLLCPCERNNAPFPTPFQSKLDA